MVGSLLAMDIKRLMDLFLYGITFKLEDMKGHGCTSRILWNFKVYKRYRVIIV